MRDHTLPGGGRSCTGQGESSQGERRAGCCWAGVERGAGSSQHARLWQRTPQGRTQRQDRPL